MPNVFKHKPTKETVPPKREVLHQSDIPASFISERMMKDMVIKRGTTRPDGTTHTKAFFNTSSGVLSIWDGSAWLETTLTS